MWAYLGMGKSFVCLSLPSSFIPHTLIHKHVLFTHFYALFLLVYVKVNLKYFNIFYFCPKNEIQKKKKEGGKTKKAEFKVRHMLSGPDCVTNAKSQRLHLML